jgi:hypothetical protein
VNTNIPALKIEGLQMGLKTQNDSFLKNGSPNFDQILIICEDNPHE